MNIHDSTFGSISYPYFSIEVDSQEAVDVSAIVTALKHHEPLVFQIKNPHQEPQVLLLKLFPLSEKTSVLLAYEPGESIQITGQVIQLDSDESVKDFIYHHLSPLYKLQNGLIESETEIEQLSKTFVMLGKTLILFFSILSTLVDQKNFPSYSFILQNIQSYKTLTLALFSNITSIFNRNKQSWLQTGVCRVRRNINPIQLLGQLLPLASLGLFRPIFANASPTATPTFQPSSQSTPYNRTILMDNSTTVNGIVSVNQELVSCGNKNNTAVCLVFDEYGGLSQAFTPPYSEQKFLITADSDLFLGGLSKDKQSTIFTLISNSIQYIKSGLAISNEIQFTAVNYNSILPLVYLFGYDSSNRTIGFGITATGTVNWQKAYRPASGMPMKILSVTSPPVGSSFLFPIGVITKEDGSKQIVILPFSYDGSMRTNNIKPLTLTPTNTVFYNEENLVTCIIIQAVSRLFFGGAFNDCGYITKTTVSPLQLASAAQFIGGQNTLRQIILISSDLFGIFDSRGFIPDSANKTCLSVVKLSPDSLCAIGGQVNICGPEDISSYAVTSINNGIQIASNLNGTQAVLFFIAANDLSLGNFAPEYGYNSFPGVFGCTSLAFTTNTTKIAVSDTSYAINAIEELNEPPASLTQLFPYQKTIQSSPLTWEYSPTSPPTTYPTIPPTRAPSGSPTIPPTREPTAPPTTYPTIPPTEEPSGSPTAPPTTEPTAPPTTYPTIPPTREPTAPPTTYPTIPPTREPTAPPTTYPTIPPTEEPSGSPTTPPTTEPSNPPSSFPSTKPVSPPTAEPTSYPTIPPTEEPTTPPTTKPSNLPSSFPSTKPASPPTASPSRPPTSQPTSPPSPKPSPLPSLTPSTAPTAQATTKSPTSIPTNTKTNSPTPVSTLSPSASPTTSAPLDGTILLKDQATINGLVSENQEMIACGSKNNEASCLTFDPYQGLTQVVNLPYNEQQFLVTTGTDLLVGGISKQQQGTIFLLLSATNRQMKKGFKASQDIVFTAINYNAVGSQFFLLGNDLFNKIFASSLSTYGLVNWKKTYQPTSSVSMKGQVAVSSSRTSIVYVASTVTKNDTSQGIGIIPIARDGSVQGNGLTITPNNTIIQGENSLVSSGATQSSTLNMFVGGTFDGSGYIAQINTFPKLGFSSVAQFVGGQNKLKQLMMSNNQIFAVFDSVGFISEATKSCLSIVKLNPSNLCPILAQVNICGPEDITTSAVSSVAQGLQVTSSLNNSQPVLFFAETSDLSLGSQPLPPEYGYTTFSGVFDCKPLAFTTENLQVTEESSTTTITNNIGDFVDTPSSFTQLFPYEKTIYSSALLLPTSAPTNFPVENPTSFPSVSPMIAPSSKPTKTANPTISLKPSTMPSTAPSTIEPSAIPTLFFQKSLAPSKAPVFPPSLAPTLAPERVSIIMITQPPVAQPTLAPSASNGNIPTWAWIVSAVAFVVFVVSTPGLMQGILKTPTDFLMGRKQKKYQTKSAKKTEESKPSKKNKPINPRSLHSYFEDAKKLSEQGDIEAAWSLIPKENEKTVSLPPQNSSNSSNISPLSHLSKDSSVVISAISSDTSNESDVESLYSDDSDDIPSENSSSNESSMDLSDRDSFIDISDKSSSDTSGKKARSPYSDDSFNSYSNSWSYDLESNSYKEPSSPDLSKNSDSLEVSDISSSDLNSKKVLNHSSSEESYASRSDNTSTIE